MIQKLESLIVSSVFGAEVLQQFEQGDISNKNYDAYLPEILKLSEVYNFPENKNSSILTSQKSLEAYMLYFLPINFYKLSELIKRTKLPKDRIHKVLDFGCGPGSGGLAASDYFGKNAALHLYDLSDRATQMAQNLIENYCPGVKCKIENSNWKKEKFDLIIAANAINEIKEEDKKAVLDDLVSSLSDNGVLLILEPALKVKTKLAMQTRDYILSTDENLCVLFPCTHNLPCPMLIDTEDDWCHGSMSWQSCKLIRQIDKLTGFNKHRLKYSAFIFQKGIQSVTGFRIVDIPRKDKTGFSARLCGEDFYAVSKLLKRNRNENNKMFEKADLFDLLKIESGEIDSSFKKEHVLKVVN